MLTDRDLLTIERRAAAATPGPWLIWDASEDPDGLVSATRVGPLHAAVVYGGQGHDVRGLAADLEFIAEARQDIPRLLAEIETLRGLCGGGMVKP